MQWSQKQLTTTRSNLNLMDDVTLSSGGNLVFRTVPLLYAGEFGNIDPGVQSCFCTTASAPAAAVCSLQAALDAHMAACTTAGQHCHRPQPYRNTLCTNNFMLFTHKRGKHSLCYCSLFGLRQIRTRLSVLLLANTAAGSPLPTSTSLGHHNR